MKTKIVNWITLLPLACLVILLAMGVKSQQPEPQKPVKRDSILPIIGVKIPDSTQVKLTEKSKSMNRIDSLLVVDNAWDVKNNNAIANVKKKQARFELYRQTPKVEKISKSTPSLTVSAPALPDSSITVKKKPRRSVLTRMRDFIKGQ